MKQMEGAQAPGARLIFTQTDGDTYIASVEGVGAVYWIHRSLVRGDRWQAHDFVSHKPLDGIRSMRYRNDLFDALRHRPLNGLVTTPLEREPLDRIADSARDWMDAHPLRD